MKFSKEQIEQIEDLAALNFTFKQVAMYLDIPIELFYTLYNEKDSELRYHFDRGQLLAKAHIDMSMLDSAKKGNITAQQLYDKRAKQNKLDEAKERIFRSS